MSGDYPAPVRFIAEVYEAFMAGGPDKRRWFHDPDFDLYMRLGPREFHGRTYSALTIADVTVKHPGQGTLSLLLMEVEASARMLGCDALFAENVRPELINALARRRFWVRMNSGGYADMLKELE